MKRLRQPRSSSSLRRRVRLDRATDHPAIAATSDFRGVNWADERDNFVAGCWSSVD